MAESRIITLITDFGARDAFVGMMKGVIAGICPDANVIDITHEVTPHDVRQGAFLLATSCFYFPEGAVHIAVVDPGVGTERRPIAAKAGKFTFVGPDNGLLALALSRLGPAEVVEIANPSVMLPSAGTTFHGRDVFAPAAAHLAEGMPLAQLGPAVDRIEPLAFCEPKVQAGEEIAGEVVHVDRFGNAVTNIPSPLVAECFGPEGGGTEVRAGEPTEVFPLKKTFADVAEGEAVAYAGSAGYLELAVNRGSAARAFALASGRAVTVRRVKEPSNE